ncbi:hypothetical protein HPB48_008850 [Haemaphysalis longicornis]|uniref:C2H2-type domain-containing protein n=1 Tax=Haemaphysalis longicornis TaxID=44386 RepID=A0A9J6H175_HAELO|nr:hypothetical protein HPB48_008850 [Haemaphysalis longicornis]
MQRQAPGTLLIANILYSFSTSSTQELLTRASEEAGREAALPILLTVLSRENLLSRPRGAVDPKAADLQLLQEAPSLSRRLGRPRESAHREEAVRVLRLPQTLLHVYHLNSHRKTHLVEKLLHCRFCPRLFKRRSTWSKHEKEHLKKERPHPCEVCQKRFSRKRDLVLHMRVHTGEKPYKCDVCDRRFAQRSAFTSHLRTHTGEKRHVCRFCSRGYARRTSLEMHERRDHASDVAGRSCRQRYSCSSCLLRFTRKGELDFHERTQHTKEPNGTGEESFSSREDVDMQEGVHTGEESYACRFCPESYAEKGDLDAHERAHTNIAKYFCSFCPSSFSTHRGLLAHKRTAHRGTPQKPYTCRFCPQAYDRPGRLKKHERKHADNEPTTEPEKHVCTVCDKSFSCKEDLANHKKLHSGEKPYECSICSKRFVEEHQLSSHIMSHSTVKSYSCTTCQEDLYSNE